MEQDLFGQTKEQQPQRFPVSTIGTARHRKCTAEEKSITTSALTKFMRLGMIDRSIQVYARMRILGVDPAYVVRRLCAFFWEDAVGIEAAQWAAALDQSYRHDTDNAIERSIIAACKSPHFWDHDRQRDIDPRSESELEADRLRIKHEEEAKAKRGAMVIDDFPDYCHDVYCIQGRRQGVTEKHSNCRYSGIIRGGINLRAETICYGRPTPEKPSLFNSDPVVKAAKEWKSLDQWMRENGYDEEKLKKEISAQE